MIKAIEYAGILEFSAVVILFLCLETKFLPLHYKLIWNKEFTDRRSLKFCFTLLDRVLV